MNIHEYQAKDLFREYGIPVPEGRVAESPQEAEHIAASLGCPVVVKAQIHAGGRGKAGGVKPASTPGQAGQAAEALLGRALVTHQTGPEGRVVRRVLVEKGRKVACERYVSITLDRSRGCPVLMVSPDGGMDIEGVAAEYPERILRVPVDPLYGLADFEARRAAAFLGFEGRNLHVCARVLKNLFRLYEEKDASLAEINPLVVTEEGEILALDAKLNLEDNALFRHPELAALEDPEEEDPLEREAGKHGLNYIRLEGNIGVMVNGAGLAMATMDLIKQAGASPANFLDVGGGAGAEKIAAGFRIILSDTHVQAILINIFGGILRCDFLAEGVVRAARDTGVGVPVIVRLQGTHAEEGRKILAQSGLKFTVAENLSEAARLVAEVSGQ
ncbi:ADP-forming succinate--CoA ligase subunit beta [Mailhella massiliensis]|uniref:Succinate--CoA ligase [ADP-forming] subunit beta n=1 Tax=Mailhella massiliensis TaxID=1903261 RepID=A0A921AX26_9BACT|nr:ADP-forming succinate--CoA ligase subunit beta [Mailhella massiliensis]HJD97704.1 ADP-forming succinate--CoA ligase subunit beta [Mailhella massiliensis]